jgi:hypothetical protein
MQHCRKQARAACRAPWQPLPLKNLPALRGKGHFFILQRIRPVPQIPPFLQTLENRPNFSLD